jgi:hypothetical protein
MVTKHSAQNVSIFTPKVSISAPKVSLFAPNVSISAQNVSIERTHTKQCDKCNRMFETSYSLTRHIKICTGFAVHPLQCQYCKKMYKHPSCKSRHLKICKVKAEIDSKALVIVQSDEHCVPCTITNVHTVNNTVVNSTTSNSNNRITNIIVYKPDMEFLNDHIQNDKLLQWLNSYDHETTMKSYSREIMSRPENRFVKKTNLRSSTSSVHVGENNWEMRLDKELYPEIMCTIANGFSLLLEDKVVHSKPYKHILTDHARKRMYKSLDAFIDYMASNGYCNDRDDDKVKHVATFFNTLVKELKIMAFNYTRPASS